MLVFSRPHPSVVAVRKASKSDKYTDEQWDDEQNAEIDKYENDLALAFLFYISSLQATLATLEGDSVEGWLKTNGVIDQMVEQTSQATLRAVMGDITRAGVQAAADFVPSDLAASMTISSQNPFLQKYVQEQTGNMIANVSDSVKQQVKDVIAEGTRMGTSPKDMAQKLKDTVGLNPQQAAQYRRFVGSPAVRQAFLQRLQEQRALTIARSETVLAFQHAQLASWQYAVEQGVITGYAEKEWVTDNEPCPERCAPMQGQRRGLDQTFTTGMGEEILAPGAHPRCRCALRLIIDSDAEDKSNG